MVGEWMRQSNLKALYHLNDVNDASENGFTLTNNNSVGFMSGKFGNCADFGSANTNKYLNIGNNLGITGGNITLSTWVKIQTEISSSFWYLISQDSSTNNVSYLIVYNYNGGTRRIELWRVRQGTSIDQVNYNVSLGISNWHHLALVYDGTNLFGYINGLSIPPTAYSGNGSSGGVNNFSVGAGTSGQNPASAFIDETAIFNTALTPKQIKDYYSWSVGRYARIV